MVGAFGGQIAEQVGAGVHRLLSCAFTTTSDIERVAGGIVMMSAFKRYFDYALVCICGIPEITLEGTPADWAEIRRRIDVLAEYDLEWWAVALRPVLDELVRTAESTPNRDFWQCIYKPREVYGGEVVTGWIMRLFPYVTDQRSPAVLEAKPSTDPRARFIGPELAPSSVPLAWSSARLRVIDANGKETALSLFGGFGGVRQLADGSLRPDVAWAVGETPRMTRVLERMVAEHVANPKSDGEPEPSGPQRYLELPAELIELYEKTDGGALYGRWTLPRRSELGMLVGSCDRGFAGLDPRRPKAESYSPASELPVLPFCLLDGDARFLALYEGLVVLCDPRVAVDVEAIPVIAMSAGEFFELLFQHEGKPWFDSEPSVSPRHRPGSLTRRRANLFPAVSSFVEDAFEPIFALLRKGDVPAALARLEACREWVDRSDASTRATYHQTLASALDDCGRTVEALVEARAALAIDLEHWPEAHGTWLSMHSLYIILERLGRDDEAAALSEELVALGETLDAASFACAAAVRAKYLTARERRVLLERARFRCCTAWKDSAAEDRHDLAHSWADAASHLSATYVELGDLVRAELAIVEVMPNAARFTTPALRRAVAMMWGRLGVVARERSDTLLARYFFRCALAVGAERHKPTLLARLDTVGGHHEVPGDIELDGTRIARVDAASVLIADPSRGCLYVARELAPPDIAPFERVQLRIAAGRVRSVRRVST